MALTIPKSFSGTPASIKAQAEALLAKATTLAEINAITLAARSSNVNVDSTKLAQYKDTITQAAAKAKAAADKIAADKAIAEKAAASKAATDKALAAQKIQQDAAIAATAAKLKTQYTAELKQASTTQQVNDILAKAKSNGVTLDTPAINAANSQLKLNDFNTKLNNAKTVAEVNALVNQANTDKLGYDQIRVNNVLTPLKDAEAKAAADKIAADKTTQPVAPPPPTQPETLAKINQLRTNFINDVINPSTAKGPTTQAQIDAYVKAVTDLGGKPEASLVTRAQGYITQAAEAAKLSQLQGFRNEIIKATYDQSLTKSQVADIAARAEKAGTPLDTAAITNANASAQKFLTSNYETQVSNATTQKQIDDLVAKAKTDGVTVNSTLLANTTKNVASRLAWNNEVAKFVTDQQQMPGMPKTTYGPGGSILYSIPPDPTTGFKGGWYNLDSGNNTWRELGRDGQQTGKILAQTDLDTQANTVGYNLAMKAGDLRAASGYASGLKDPAKWEATLPKVTTADYAKAQLVNQNLRYGTPGLSIPNDGHNAQETYSPRTGPDGTDYIYQPANIATGAPGQWLKSTSNQNVSNTLKNYVPVGQPTAAPVSYKNQVAAIDQSISQNYDTARQIGNQMSDQYAQEQAALRFSNSGGDDIFAAFDKLVNKTVGWKTIATMVGSYLGGPLGAALANATVGAVKGESIEQIAKGAALSYAMAYGTEALGEALNEAVATGVEVGEIDPGNATEFGSGVEEIQAPTPEGPVAPETPVNIETPTGPVEPGPFEPGPGPLEPGPSPVESGPFEPGPGPEPTVPEYTAPTPEPIAPVAPEVAPVPGAPVAGTPGTEGFSQAELNAIAEGQKLAEAPGAYTPVAGEGSGLPPGGKVTVELGTSPVEPPGGWTPQPIPEIPAEVTIPGDLGGTYYPEGIPATGEAIATASRELGLSPAQIIALGGVAAATAAVASMGAGGASSAANAIINPPATIGMPVEPPPVEPPVAPPVEPPVAPPGQPGPGPLEPGPGPIEPGPGPVEPPVAPPPVAPPVEPPVAPPPVTPPTGGPVPGPFEPGPVPVEPPVAPPVEPPVAPPVEPPVAPPVEPPPVEPPPVEPPVAPPVEPPPVEPPTQPPVKEPAPVYDYSTPYEGPYSNESVLERFMASTLTYGDVAKLVAAGLVLPSILGVITPTTQPNKKAYGPIPPVEWGSAAALVNPGQNPGWFAGNFPKPAYQTTNPYQAQFFWGQHPYVGPNESRDIYNQVQPGAGTQGFGLQAGPAQYDVNQLINQINTTPNLGLPSYDQYPTQGYVAPGYPTPVTGPSIPVPLAVTTGFVR